MDENRRKTVGKVLLHIFLFITIVLFVAMCACFVTFLIIKKVRKDDEKEIFNYRLFQLNREMNESSVGFVKIYEELSEGYIYNVNELGIHQLISNFDTDEYICSGSCSCETSRRNAVTQSLSKGLVFLVAALSSVTAISLAKNHFHEECLNLHKNKCNLDSIRSDVETCDLAHKSTKSVDDDDDDGQEVSDVVDEDGMTEEEFDTTEKRRYICEGHCVSNDYELEIKMMQQQAGYDELYVSVVKMNLGEIQYRSNMYGCSKMWLTEAIEEELPMEKFWNKIGKKEVKYIEDDFLQFHLTPYCERLSVVNIKINKKGAEFEGPLKMCSGHIKSQNPSVDCVLDDEPDEPDLPIVDD